MSDKIHCACGLPTVCADHGPESLNVSELRAENERLRAENDELRTEFHVAHFQRLEAENERLRATLEQYADTSNWSGDEWRGPTDHGWVLAQRAL